MAYPIAAALEHPEAAAVHLLRHSSLYGVAEANGRTGSLGSAVFDLTLLPLPALAAGGYPIERARLVIIPPGDRIHAYPRGGGARPYRHRNPWPGDLCLQYNRDDPALRWLPADGLEALVTLLHRHLIFEEACRRTGTWPSEDAPHGDAAEPHPVTTAKMREELRRWARR